MQAAAVELNSGTYKEPLKMTVSEWLDIWLTDYLGGVKPMTVLNYTQHVKNHIKPALGAIKLEALNTHEIQSFYNDLQKAARRQGETVCKDHQVRERRAAQGAAAGGGSRLSAFQSCRCLQAARVERKEIKPLDSEGNHGFYESGRGFAL